MYTTLITFSSPWCIIKSPHNKKHYSVAKFSIEQNQERQILQLMEKKLCLGVLAEHLTTHTFGAIYVLHIFHT
jgi:hypothetical protein